MSNSTLLRPHLRYSHSIHDRVSQSGIADSNIITLGDSISGFNTFEVVGENRKSYTLVQNVDDEDEWAIYYAVHSSGELFLETFLSSSTGSSIVWSATNVKCSSVVPATYIN